MALLSTCALSGLARAEILYSHTFDGDGSPLGGVAPDVANTGTILGADHGTSAANWNDAGVNQDGTFDEMIYNGSVHAAPAELPFKPVSGFIYTLRFTGTVSGNGTNWLGGGFINRFNTLPLDQFHFSPILYAFTRPGSTDSIKQLASNDPYGNLRTTGSGRVGTSTNTASASTITIELNTVGGNNSWDVRWLVNGTQFASISNISDVAQANMEGVGIAGFTVADIQSFSLEVTVPSITIQSLSPQGNGIFPGTNLTATFSETIALADSGTITLTDKTDGSDTRTINLPDPAQLSVSGTNLIINPATPLELGTNYEIVISAGAVRRSGSTVSPFAGTSASQWTFRTADPDPTAPLINGKSPADDASSNPYNSNIVATFNENIVAGSGTITLKNLTNPSRSRMIAVTDASQVTISGAVLTIDPSFPLDADTDYAVQLSSGTVLNYSDVPFAGNPETDVTSWNFRTGSPSVVDILIAYTPAVLAHHGTEAGMMAHLQACIASTNNAYAESGVTGQLRLVGTRLVNYTESNQGLNTDADRLINASDGFMDEIHTMRNEKGADLVCLFRKGSFANAWGVAKIPLSANGSPTLGFSVVTTEGALSIYAFAHELGHNMGLGHGRGDDTTYGVFQDSHGHRFYGLSGTQYHTIMAYQPGTQSGRFSNPDVNFDGVATGVGPPSAPNSANAARTLSIMMPVIAGYRAAPASAPPVWSSSPFSPPSAIVGLTYQTDISVFASDLNLDTLTYGLASGPAWLSMTNPSTGRVTGTPTSANLGQNTFTVTVSDGVHPAVEATMTINVIPTSAATWLGISGNWNDPGIWSGGGFVDSANAEINFTGTDITADRTVTLNGNRTAGYITFTDSGVSSHNLTLSGAQTLSLDVSSGSPSINVTQADRILTLSSIVAGNKGLQKTGTGQLTLSGNNTYTGATTISAGTLRLEGSAFSTKARDYAISSGAVLYVASTQIPTGTTTISGSGTLRGAFNATSTGRTLNLNMGAGGVIDVPSGSSSLNGGYSAIHWSTNLATLNVDGTLNIWDGNAITAAALTGAGTIESKWNGGTAANFTLGVNNGSGTFSGSITAPNTRVISLVKTGTGTQTLSGSATFRGTTTIDGGTLQFAKSSSLYAGTSTSWVKTKIIVNTGGTIAFNVGGTNEFTTGNIATLLGGLGGAVNNNGLRAGSTIAFDTTNASSGTFTISDAIANTTGTGGGAVGLRKLGTNTLVLSNANTYAGPTNVDQGTLSVTGSLGATAVSVNGGTLSGNGNFGGDVTIAAGAVHSLAVAATTASQDTIAINGTLAMEGSTLSLSAASTPAAGVYVLATATAGITGTPTIINYNGITGTVSVDTGSTPKRLLLTVAGAPYGIWADANAPGRAADDDFDGDGVPNAIEFVLGGDKDSNDADKLPTVAISGGNMTFTFIRKRESIDPSVSVTIEVGTNLTAWPDVFTVGADTAGSTEGVTVTDNGDSSDTITLTIPQAALSNKFARLKVGISP
jgi:autotransporter-associated beta strand protein